MCVNLCPLLTFLLIIPEGILIGVSQLEVGAMGAVERVGKKGRESGKRRLLILKSALKACQSQTALVLEPLSSARSYRLSVVLSPYCGSP